MVEYWKQFTGFPIERHGVQPTKVEPSGRGYDRTKEKENTRQEIKEEQTKKVDLKPMKIRLEPKRRIE